MRKKQCLHSESHARSLVKAVIWRLMGTVVTIGVAWIISREITLAAKLGLADTVVKIGAMYVYERMWNRIPYGRSPQRPDYEI